MIIRYDWETNYENVNNFYKKSFYRVIRVNVIENIYQKPRKYQNSDYHENNHKT